MMRVHGYALFALWALACSGGDPNPANKTGKTALPPDSGGPIRGGVNFGSGPFLTGDCDSLVPSHCGFPFPSDVYLVDDARTPTGKHVEFGATTLPITMSGVQATPDEFRRSDGFSPGQAPMTHMPGATTVGLPTPLTIEHSLDADSPTVIIDAQTGEWIPHFSELDMSADSDDQRAFMLRPVERLHDSTRYIVAIRHVVDASGKRLEPSPVFKALRDGEASGDASVERRREMYKDIFARLEAAGVKKDDLQLAWDFSTASTQNLTGWMLHIRDEALANTGADGPPYRITAVQTDYSASTKVRIDGMITVPLYLDQPGTGGKFVFGSDGMPMQNGTAEYPFVVLVPQSAQTKPGIVVQNGHGLFGTREQVLGFETAANDFDWVLVATDFIGMAQEDVGTVVGIISGGDIGGFRTVPDRLCQGFLNMVLVTRMMRGAFARDPAVQFNGHSAIDTSTSYYFGGSQGGIFGASFMAITPDIPRGGLAVPGQPYNLLLNRSVDFAPYLLALKSSYPNSLDIQLLLGAAQMQWDRAEPTGYSHHIEHDPLPGTPSHTVLMQVAIGDHQVTTLGGHIMARAIGAKQLQPVNRSIFDIDEVAAPYSGGSAMIEYSFGLPPEPIVNLPMDQGEDPHGKIKDVPAAGQALRTFLETGVVEATCDGPCDPG